MTPLNIPSAEQVVYEALRTEILRGAEPGTPLQLGTLAKRFEVSTMPVRTALTRLEGEGLVVQRPRRGARVAALTVDDFLDLYAIRVGLEGVAARIGGAAVPASSFPAMRKVLGEMAAVVEAPNGKAADDYLPLDWRLHDLCYTACQRPKMMDLIHQYRRQSERYFRMYLRHPLDLDADFTLQEEFVRACEAHDGDAAEAAVRSLFQSTTARVLADLKDVATSAIPLMDTENPPH